MERIQILTESKSTERVWNAQIIPGFGVDKVIKKRKKDGGGGGRKNPLFLPYTLRLWEQSRRESRTSQTGAQRRAPSIPAGLRSGSRARAGAPQLLSAELLAWAGSGLLA